MLGNLAGFSAPFMIGYVKTQTGSTAIGLQVIAVYGCLVALMALSVTRGRRYSAHEVERLARPLE
jgi:nitrate/nitrite transporter NarK